MSNIPDDPWLVGLGAAVSDGGHVDWSDAEQRSQGADQRRLVQQLRSVAAIVKAHQSVSHTVGEILEPESTGAAGPITAWRHLVLFECIGTGAFGKVYRAWDPLLDREVAVKLLAREKAAGARALDEARHLARIRHSNIVVVHGADEDAERAGIWMEYIEGLTLAQMVRERGPMSPREAAGIGLDLCSALSAIHGAGLLHLDIKAQNVMREVGGRIVLMDFSGAYAVRASGAARVLSGTPLYMAPELFLGGEATPASDVYSLGVLLFFLLSGRLPVEGASSEAVREAHAKGERTRLRDVRSDVPDALVQVIERATAPDLAERFRTAGELEHALASSSGLQVAALPHSAHGAFSYRRLAVWALAGALLIAVGALAALAGRPRVPQAWTGLARFTIGPPYTTGSWPRVSPDGRYVVFGAFVEGKNRFWLHPVNSLAGRSLMNTTATESPFWSPDSTTLCFFEDEKLKAVQIERGEPRVLADAPNPRGGDWHGDTILYSREEGIFRLNVRDSTIEQLTAVDRQQGDQLHSWPEFLPDGRRFLYLIRSTNADRAGIYVGSLDGSPSWRLLPAYSRTAYAAGHILYVRDGSLVAHPVDPRSLALRGDPVTLAARVGYHSLSDAAFDVSSNGVLIYSLEGDQPSTRLALLDNRGRHLESLTDVGWFGRPRFSPDGQRIVAEKFDTEDKNSELWVYGLAPRSETRLTRHPAPDVSPVWSPDGRRIAFSSRRRAVYDIFVKPLDAVANEHPLLSTPDDEYAEHWSPDGRYLSVSVTRSGLWIVSVDGSEKPRRVRANPTAQSWQSEFSPDGRWLAYMSTESGQPEVYVEPFPGDGSRWQVSTRGGSEPHWRGSSDLLYIDASSVLTSVQREGPGWRPTAPQRLFELSVPELTGRTDYAVSPDGRLIVVNAFVADPLIPPIEVVVNWTTLLNR